MNRTDFIKGCKDILWYLEEQEKKPYRYMPCKDDTPPTKKCAMCHSDVKYLCIHWLLSDTPGKHRYIPCLDDDPASVESDCNKCDLLRHEKKLPMCSVTDVFDTEEEK